MNSSARKKRTQRVKRVVKAKKKRTSNTLTLSSGTLTLKPKKEPVPAPESKPKPKKVVEPVISKKQKCNMLNKELRKESEVWRRRMPLKIGILEDIFDGYASKYSKSAIMMLVNTHTKRFQYLKNVEAGGDRYSLDGTVTGQVTEKEIAYATKMARAKDRNFKDEDS